MNKKIMFLPVFLLFTLFINTSATFPVPGSFEENLGKRVSFLVRGNGKTNVELGIGYQVGSGSCCRGVSKESTVSFTGEVGDVLYDGKTRRIITKVYAEMEGKTIDLREYY